MVDRFANMFWRAEGFCYAWVPFEFRNFNNLGILLSLEKQRKQMWVDKSKNGLFG